MLYKDFLKDLAYCPFCQPMRRVIVQEQNAFLTYSLAPYHKHHLLVIPNNHVEQFQDLTSQETQSIEKLLHK
ncbi:MAG: HIT domain-containing protein [bacterium]